MSDKDPKTFFRDMRDWQNKQYLPGAYTGPEAPFPVKQFGKHRWFRRTAIIWLVIFFALVIFSLSAW